MPIPFIAVAIVGALTLGGGAVATVATVAAVNEANNSDEATIDRVIDGDTVDVRMYGDVHRVRLLNINSPEDNAGTGVTECMGAEATAALAGLLPEGTPVTLRYDSDRNDRYDRLLAGVFVDDTLVNAEMAREGLAVPLVVGDNERFIREVQSAEAEARESQAGIFGATLPCTLGSTVANYRSQVEVAVSSALPTDSASITEVIAATTVVLAAADGAEVAVDAVGWVTPDLRKTYKTEIRELKDKLTQAKAGQEASYASAVAAEKAEADRIAAEEAARAAADQAARDAAERQTSNGGSSDSSNNGSSSGDGGGSTYTGCRNYNGYGMIDPQGRHFEPIPCP